MSRRSACQHNKTSEEKSHAVHFLSNTAAETPFHGSRGGSVPELRKIAEKHTRPQTEGHATADSTHREPQDLACDNQAFAGHNHPATVLPPYCIHSAKARHGVAGIHLKNPQPAPDQRAAIGDVAQSPALHLWQLPNFGLRRSRRGRGYWSDRSSDIFRRRKGHRDRNGSDRRRGAKLLHGL